MVEEKSTRKKTMNEKKTIRFKSKFMKATRQELIIIDSLGKSNFLIRPAFSIKEFMLPIVASLKKFHKMIPSSIYN
jgi:hypothetical protein